MLYQDTITDKMYDVAKKLVPLLNKDFYLAGGTALSLQIGHRESVDLDYFTENDIDTDKLFENIENIFLEVKILKTYEEKNTLWIIVDGIKISFITRNSKLLKSKVEEDIFLMASQEDILIMKLSAICSRSEYKDYYDIVCISKMIDPRSWVSFWSEINPNSDPLSWLVALSDVLSAEHLELKGKNILKQKDVIESVKKIVLEINNFLRFI